VAQPIPLYLPFVDDTDLDSLRAALRPLAAGASVRTLEQRVAELARRPFGVAAGSPGGGLEIALRALGIGAGDEVIVPSLGAVEAADAVVRTHATPVFADVDPRSLSLTAEIADRLVTDRTRAVLAFTMLGDAGSLEALARLCTKHEVPLVEDASDAIGATVGGEPVGRFGRIAIFSMTDDRVVPASGATVLVTHDDRLAAQCRRYRDGGSAESAASLERVGVDSPLDDLRAAIAANRLRRLDAAIEARRRLADLYLRHLAGQTELILPAPRGDGGGCWPRFCVRLSDQFTRFDRDEILAGMRRHEIAASEGPLAVPTLPRHGHRIGHASGSYPVSERASDRAICLPFYEGLAEREVELVAATLELMISRNSFRRE
jgi:perosamine synthetase